MPKTKAKKQSAKPKLVSVSRDGKITVNQAALEAHLKRKGVDEDDAQYASTAAHALQDVEKLFYRTAIGDLISEVMAVCDTVAETCEEYEDGEWE